MNESLLTPDIRSRIRAKYRILLLFWFFMLGSLILYGAMGCFLKSSLTEAAADDFRTYPLDVIRNCLYGASVLLFAAVYFIRKKMMKSRPANTDAALNPYFTLSVVTWALIENIAVFGLVLFILGDTERTLFIFIGVSAAGLFYYPPKKDEFKTFIEQAARQPIPRFR